MSSVAAGPVPRLDHRWSFLVLAVGTFAFSLLQSTISPVLPLLQRSLNTTQGTVTWVLTAYLLSASVFTPILGRLGDAYGKRRVLVVALAMLAAGSVMAALAGSIGVMLAARAVQGVGGGVLPLSFGIIRDEFPREKVPSAVGAISALLAVGGGLGLVLAGPIVNATSYHWLFWIPGAVVAVAAVATFVVIPDSPVRSPGGVAWLSAVLLSGWLLALLVAVSQAPRWGWVSPRVLALFAAAVLLALAWARAESRAPHPLVDLRMMRLRAVWTTNLVAFLFGIAMYAVFAFLPQFLQTPRSAGYGFGATVTQAGLLLLPMTVGMFAFGTASGWLSGRFGSKAVLLAGTAMSVPAFALMAFVHGEVWQLLLAVALFGAGFGLAFSAMANLIVDAVPSHQTGVASGMNANIRTVGGSVGAAVTASVVTAHVGPGGLPLEAGYTVAFTVLLGAVVLALLAGTLIPALHVVRDAHQEEQAALAHGHLAIVAGGTVVGDDPE